MLIKFGARVICLNQVSYFYKCEESESPLFPFSIRFDLINSHRSNIGWYFEKEEERDKAFEKILHCYEQQQMICELD